MQSTHMSFNEMVARFDVTPRTLRYYEEIELLSPERRGRARIYGPREQARMTLILRGRRFGSTLEEIRQWLNMYQSEGPQTQLAVFVDMANTRIDALTAQHTALGKDIDDLRALRDLAIGELQAASDRKQARA